LLWHLLSEHHLLHLLLGLLVRRLSWLGNGLLRHTTTTHHDALHAVPKIDNLHRLRLLSSLPRESLNRHGLHACVLDSAVHIVLRHHENLLAWNHALSWRSGHHLWVSLAAKLDDDWLASVLLGLLTPNWKSVLHRLHC
jgi:hypothetical protein